MPVYHIYTERTYMALVGVSMWDRVRYSLDSNIVHRVLQLIRCLFLRIMISPL